MSAIFTPEELAEIAAADAEIECEFELTLEEYVASQQRDYKRDVPRREEKKRYYIAHREKKLAYQREYDRTHDKRQYVLKHPEIKTYQRAYREAHKEKMREYQRKYYQKRKERREQREAEAGQLSGAATAV